MAGSGRGRSLEDHLPAWRAHEWEQVYRIPFSHDRSPWRTVRCCRSIRTREKSCPSPATTRRRPTAQRAPDHRPIGQWSRPWPSTVLILVPHMPRRSEAEPRELVEILSSEFGALGIGRVLIASSRASGRTVNARSTTTKAQLAAPRILPLMPVACASEFCNRVGRPAISLQDSTGPWHRCYSLIRDVPAHKNGSSREGDSTVKTPRGCRAPRWYAGGRCSQRVLDARRGSRG
jgi:hypothetical protein